MTKPTLHPYPADYPWSKSALGTMLEVCSWQWTLAKVFKQPGWTTPANAIGTAYHSGLEAHERARIIAIREGREHTSEEYEQIVLDAAAESYEHEWQRIPEHLPELHGVSKEDGAAAYNHAIDAWWGGIRPTLLTYRPLMVEPYVKVSHPASPRGVAGYVDWVGYDHDERQWVVVDHKSAGSFRMWKPGGEGHEIEASLYLFAAMLATQLPVRGPVRMEWHVARTQVGTRANFERARIVRSELGFDEGQDILADALREADAMADNLAVAQNPASFLCSEKWCSYWSKCVGPESEGPDALTPEALLG